MPRSIPVEAIALVKRFEGLHLRIGPNELKSYLCPSGIWTIGWGSTHLRGRPVDRDTYCTIDEAAVQLRNDLQNTGKAVASILTAELTDAQFGALVSLVYNIGIGNFQRSTLLRRLNSGESASKVFKEEFLRWTKGSHGNVLQGLVFRRHAELTLLEADSSVAPLPIATMIRLSDAAKYDKGLARQAEAWRYLFQTAPKEAWDAMQERLSIEVVDRFGQLFRGEAVGQPENPQAAASKLLQVPYYSQRDNYRDADRTCFSSTCAMALKHLRPSAIKSDDDYIRKVFSLGDTTDAAVQVRALASFGVEAVFRQNANFDLIKSQIDAGKTVPFGWVHRGPVERPTGSGHWALAIGYTETGLVVHDPWGEPDLISGATLSSKGQGLQYSYKNLGRRWMVESIGGNAYRYAPNKGWCLVLK